MSLPKTNREAADAASLATGLREAAEVTIRDTDLSHAVGHSGVITLSLRVALYNGRAQWTKGSVAFERRIELS